MKYDAMIIGIITIILTLFGNWVTSLFNPSKLLGENVVFILFALLVVIYIAAIFYFHGERISSNQFVAVFQQYYSLWLLVLLVSLLNLAEEELMWVGVGTKYTLLLICVFSIIGYIQEYYNRKENVIAAKLPGPVDRDLSPYDFKNSKYKKK
jgi:hypothetical protein